MIFFQTPLMAGGAGTPAVKALTSAAGAGAGEADVLILRDDDGEGEGDEEGDRPLRDALARLKLLETGDDDDDDGGDGSRGGGTGGGRGEGASSDYDDDDDNDDNDDDGGEEPLTDELLEAQIADLRRRIAEDDAMSLASSTPTPAATRPSTAVHPSLSSEEGSSSSSQQPPAPPPPVGDASAPAPAANADEADGEEWNDRLALAQDDELEELAARLGSYKPTQASLRAEEEAEAAREAARGELGGYLADLQNKTNEDGEAAVLFPSDFSALVADLFKTKIRDELKAAVGDVKGKGAAADDDDGDDGDGDGGSGGGGGDGGERGGGSSSAAAAAAAANLPEHHNPEYDLDPKIAAGLERIKRLDKQLFSKNAEAAIVRREVYPEKYFDPVHGQAAVAKKKAEEDIHKEKSRRKKLAKLRRALRGEAAVEMGGAAARNAAAVGTGDTAMSALARRFLQLSPEEDALAEKLLADFEASGGFDDVSSVATSAVTAGTAATGQGWSVGPSVQSPYCVA